jgi:hypothetical protein
MTNLAHVVRQLKTEKERLASELKAIGAALTAFGTAYGNHTRRKLSASARERIAAAQRARWAKVKSRQKQNVVTMPKRTMSAAARKRIAAAQRARWAKLRAQKKSA